MSILHACNYILGILKIYYKRYWRLKNQQCRFVRGERYKDKGLRFYRFKVRRYFVWGFFHETRVESLQTTINNIINKQPLKSRQNKLIYT